MAHLLLPLHGFVLAGGKSSRMGSDKALLEFAGRPMIDIAVAKLRSFCEAVSIAGNRDDLNSYAPIAHEQRTECGPAAGIEAGLQACLKEWAIFIPVDVPLVSVELLRNWAQAMLHARQETTGTPQFRTSFLLTPQGRQPAFCIVHRECLPLISKRLDRGEKRLSRILGFLHPELSDPTLWIASAEQLASKELLANHNLEYAFSNVNTALDLAMAESLAASDEESR